MGVILDSLAGKKIVVEAPLSHCPYCDWANSTKEQRKNPSASFIVPGQCVGGCLIGRHMEDWYGKQRNETGDLANAHERKMRAADLAMAQGLLPGRKDDHDKPMWSLLPMFIIERIVEVLNYGAKKYEPNNWQRVPKAENRYFSAAMRHLTAWQMGESTDKESGLSHLAHAACCLVFLMWFAERDAKRAKSPDEFKESISKESTNEA